MLHPADLLRLARIQWVLVRHGIDELLLATPWFRPLRFLAFLTPGWWLARGVPRGVRIRRALEALGPIFVKFGQALSTRRDLLPEDIADELALLQDRVPPFPGAQARRIVERALGRPVAEAFAAFDDAPLASASIAQVHPARLPDGREVVVKVLRPGIERVIRRDVRLLHLTARLLARYVREARRLRPVEVVAEFERTVSDELDLMREAANCSQLRRNFEGSPLLYVPEVHWPYCRREVMVLERIHGVPIGDIDALRARGVDLKRLSETGVEIFFTQVFVHNFFHADMHPGNIFVDATDPARPRYMAVDFGIMGALGPDDQRYLAENFFAFFRRDYRRVAELHVESGWVPRGTRVEEFEMAIRAVCEPIFERPLKEISFGRLLLRLFQTARRFHMEVQPQLVLLQKTLLAVEGLGRQLYPDLDLWKTAKPFFERWMRERSGLGAVRAQVHKELPRWSETVPALPRLAHDVLARAAGGELEVRLADRALDGIRREIRAANRRTVRAVTGAGLLVAALLAAPLAAPAWGGLPWLSWGLGAAALAALAAAWRR